MKNLNKQTDKFKNLNQKQKMKTQNSLFRKCFIVMAIIVSLTYTNLSAAPGVGGQIGGSGGPGGGGGGGNLPCYKTGQTISSDSNIDLITVPQNYWTRSVKTYIGNCIIQTEIFLSFSRILPNWNLVSSTTIPGGCSCGGSIIAYNPVSNPFTPIKLLSQSFDSVNISATISFIRLEVWDLTDTGHIVFTRNSITSANQVVSIPKYIFAENKNYVIVGFNGLNNADATISLKNSSGNLNVLKSFDSWGVIDSTDIQRTCVTYISADSVKVYHQKLDKSGMIWKGTHNSNLKDPNDLTLKLNYEACPNVNTINVQLRSSTSPFGLIDSDSSLGGGNVPKISIFEDAVNGVPYYIVIKGVNSIETWSAAPITFSSNTASYDFTAAIDKAFGNNQKLSGGIPSIFQGDANQDGFDDGSDVILTYNNSNAFITSPSTDFNCDGTTDLSDVILTFNNASNFVQMKRP